MTFKVALICWYSCRQIFFMTRTQSFGYWNFFLITSVTSVKYGRPDPSQSPSAPVPSPHSTFLSMGLVIPIIYKTPSLYYKHYFISFWPWFSCFKKEIIFLHLCEIHYENGINNICKALYYIKYIYIINDQIRVMSISVPLNIIIVCCECHA